MSRNLCTGEPLAVRVNFTRPGGSFFDLAAALYRLRKAYCTAVFCAVPRNRIFFFSQHLRQSIPPSDLPSLGVLSLSSPILSPRRFVSKCRLFPRKYLQRPTPTAR